jgi:hypothetical protein
VNSSALDIESNIVVLQMNCREKIVGLVRSEAALLVASSFGLRAMAGVEGAGRNEGLHDSARSQCIEGSKCVS